MAEEGCMACATAAGACAGEEVYRDPLVVAVTARTQINPGHLVVVTREHVRNALDMSPELLAHVMTVARDLAARQRAILGCPGVMLVFNNEEPCQTVFHAHVHVVPRWRGDEMDRTFGTPVEEQERREMARRLRGEAT